MDNTLKKYDFKKGELNMINFKTMKIINRLLSLILTLVLCLTSLSPQIFAVKDEETSTQSINSNSSEHKDNSGQKKYIIKTKNEAKAELVISRNSGKGKKLGHTKNLLATELSDAQANELASDPNVLYIEEDFILSANEAAASTINENTEWNIEAIGTNEAHCMGYSGLGIKVAVLDSGLDKWLSVNVNGAIDLVMENGEEDTDDLTGHGTAVSSIISAPFDNEELIGVAPNAELFVIKVLDSQNSSPVSRVIEGIDWCIENDIDVINLSFGTGNYSMSLNEKIQEATQKGLIIVSSAGNNGETGGLQYPAKYDNVIAVASVGADMQRVDSSATGEGLSVAAPGDQISTMGLFGGNSIVSGTSFAAAHITGVVAILLEKNPNASPEFIHALIKASSKPLGEPIEYGAGLVDLSYALEIYDEFAVNFNNHDWQSPLNTGIVSDVSDKVNYVNGLWGGTNHDIIINGLPNSTSGDIAFVKKVARTMDNDADFQGKNFPQIHVHPGHNYVSTARFLYHVIRYYWGLSTTNVMSTKPAYMGDEWSDIKSDLNTLFKKTISDRTGSTNNEKGWMAMGALAHLIGDIYAHASIVTTDALGSFNLSHFISGIAPGTDNYHPTTNNVKNDNRIMHEHLHTNLYHFVSNSFTNLQIPYRCRCFNCFKRAVNLGVVTSIKIQTFYNDNVTQGGSLYEDNANFMPRRLTKSSSYFTHLVTELKANRAFPMRAMSTTDFKLERFIEYSCCNGENTASVKSWSDLSAQMNRSTLLCNNGNCNMHSGSNTCLCKAHKTALPGTQIANPLARNNFGHYVNKNFSSTCSYTL